MNTETMKKHAFIMQVHKQPELFGRIINQLSKFNHYFFVNVDAKTTDYGRYREAVKDIDNVYFLTPRHSVHHGGISQIHCTLRLLNFVRDILPDYDFIHSISGQDYPLRCNELFDEYFEHSNKGYMLFDSEALVQKWRDDKYAWRMNYWYPNNRTSMLGKIYYRINLDKIANRFIKRDTICGLRGGWSWFTWTLMITSYVLKYLSENPAYLRRFNHSCCGDELIFATMLYPVAEQLNLDISHPLRYVSWFPKHRKTDVGSYFPYVLNVEDFEDVYNSAAFFCRKVELPESEALLDMIDENRYNTFVIENAEKINNSELEC